MPARTEKESPEIVALREEYERELVRRAYRLGELEQEIAEVKRTYENSLSWRLTQPLRAATALARGLRRR